MRLGVSWFLNPYSLLTICVSSGKLLYLSFLFFFFFFIYNMDVLILAR